MDNSSVKIVNIPETKAIVKNSGVVICLITEFWLDL
jgi:hypothetical protein